LSRIVITTIPGKGRDMVQDRVIEMLHHVVTCCDCGIVFTVPKGWQADREKKGKTFWCPNGHSLRFPNAELERRRQAALQAELDRRERVRLKRRERAAARVRAVVTKDPPPPDRAWADVAGNGSAEGPPP
jgi:hypothetical protein